MADFIASIEVDQIQKFLFASDKLQEILGAAGFVDEVVDIAENETKKIPGVEVFWPVSGVTKLCSSDLPALSKCLWRIREKIAASGMSATLAIQRVDGPFHEALGDLEQRVRRLKDSKAGEASLPESPFMARCLLQPQWPANHWRPEEQNSRRRLISQESYLRREGGKPDLLSQFKDLGYQMPREFQDLVISESDSYIALIKADGDGMGKLLAALKFSDREEAKKFSEAVDNCLKTSIIEAIRGLVPPHSEATPKYFPFLPLLVAAM